MTVTSLDQARYSRRNSPLMEVQTFARDEFLSERWDYNPGEHVTFLGPTQSGKTTLAFQLLGETVTKELPVLVLVMKPRDKVVDAWIKKYKWKKTQTWPPVIAGKKDGYVLWPTHSHDPEKDNPKLSKQFRRAILDSYHKGDRILFADELYGLVNELGLKNEVVTVYSRGASMGCGIWVASQKPTHIPTWSYNQAEHLFLAYEPDERGRKRFAEIGGIDSRFVEAQVLALKKYHWLYIRRTGPVACIVQP